MAGRWVSGTCAVLALLVTAGLVVVLLAADLNTASQAAGVVGTVLGALGLVASVAAYFRSGPGSSGGAAGAPVRRVRGGTIAVGGDANGAALGEGAVVEGPAAAQAAGPLQGPVDVASEPGGIAVGGDADNAALGRRSKRTLS